MKEKFLDEAKIFDYAYDLFKGISELNNCKFILKESDIKVSGKFYIVDKDNNFKFIYRGIKFKYQILELINMINKYLLLMNLDDIKFVLPNSEIIGEDVVNDLDTIDIEYEIDSSYDNIEFIVGNIKVVNLKIEDDNITATVKFLNLSKLLDLERIKLDEVPIDVYIYVKDEDLLDDAALISISLKDAGFKTEIQYKPIDTNSEVYENDATYAIVFDSDLTKQYSVNLIDTKTKEERVVSILDLADQLYINF